MDEDKQHLEGDEEEQEEADDNISNILAKQRQDENPFQLPEEESAFDWVRDTEFDKGIADILGF